MATTPQTTALRRGGHPISSAASVGDSDATGTVHRTCRRLTETDMIIA
jgi:hypothetical protein